MPEIVVIPISFFEATFDYKEPNIMLWLDRAVVVQALFSALKPWNIAVDDVEIITTGKPSEQGLKFKLPQKQVSFFFSPTLCRFSKDNADWQSAEDTIAIMDAAYSTLANVGKVDAATIKTVIALHMQPKTLPFIDLLRPFIAEKLSVLEHEAPKTMATVVKWDKRRVTIDGSVQIANGIFLRLEREFDGNVSYEDIAKKLRSDEEALFDAIGVKEEQP